MTKTGRSKQQLLGPIARVLWSQVKQIEHALSLSLSEVPHTVIQALCLSNTLSGLRTDRTASDALSHYTLSLSSSVALSASASYALSNGSATFTAPHSSFGRNRSNNADAKVAIVAFHAKRFFTSFRVCVLFAINCLPLCSVKLFTTPYLWVSITPHPLLTHLFWLCFVYHIRMTRASHTDSPTISIQ